MSNKKFEIEPLFEETLDLSELNGLKGGIGSSDSTGKAGKAGGLICWCTGTVIKDMEN